MKRQDDPIVVQQDFNCSAKALWNALVDIDEMTKWYFDNIPDFKPEAGFRTKFSVQSTELVFVHHWEVLDIIPQTKIVYSWQFEDYSGDSTTCFEVSGDENSSSLLLTIKIREDFPDDIPEFTRESCIGGWDYFIKDRLKAYLESTD